MGFGPITWALDHGTWGRSGATLETRNQVKPNKMPESKKKKTERIKAIDGILRELYSDGTALRHRSVFQLLVATILSAQCTDKKVNEVTEGLFARYPDPAAMSKTDIKELESAVYSTGFYRQKARAIKGCSEDILVHFDGEVPVTMEELVTLPGVGRKTANLVLGISMGIPGVVVDTHVLRLSNRMGFTVSRNAVKVESDLAELLPPERWTPFSGLLIGHGRAVCPARKPKCEICEVEEFCPRVGVS